MAVRYARGEPALGQEFRTEGYFGGVFRCSLLEERGPGVVPRIGGRAFISGYARYVLQDDDPFPEGFVLGDIWPAAIAGTDAATLAAQRRR
jgi:proline racemase